MIECMAAILDFSRGEHTFLKERNLRYIHATFGAGCCEHPVKFVSLNCAVPQNSGERFQHHDACNVRFVSDQPVLRERS